jgi:peptidyl-Lys metalloendopeptidase
MTYSLKEGYMNRSSSLVLVVLAVFAAVVASPSLAAQLTTTLAVQQDTFAASEAIAITFQMTNDTADTQYVLRYLTPIDGIEADILEIERDGQPVLYTGKLVKRPAPTAEDYIAIPAGDSLTVVFDPSAAYDMSVSAAYSVRYRSVVGAKAESEPVHIWAEGWQTEEEAALAADFGDYLAKKKPGGGGGDYNGCTTTQVNQLNTAKSNAGTMCSASIAHLAANPNGSTLYTYWFGTYASSRFNTVSNHYNALEDAFLHQHLTFDCTCTQNYYAYVYPTQPYRIYLCRVFWQAPGTGRDSKAGTLVHETSHFNVVAGTDDYVYGATGAHNLAMTNPAQAIDNADNHEYFAEDQ